LSTCKIPNHKHQITKKSQIPTLNDPNNDLALGTLKGAEFYFEILNFGHCDLFGIWDLGFDISIINQF
jgi:hypothetical protein